MRAVLASAGRCRTLVRTVRAAAAHDLCIILYLKKR
jgi:hypothetical protein